MKKRWACWKIKKRALSAAMEMTVKWTGHHSTERHSPAVKPKIFVGRVEYCR